TSTMGLLAEVLGITLPGTAGTPAVDSRLLVRAHDTGKIVVEMVTEDRTPQRVMSSASFHNAIVALAALSGAPNVIVHLLAIAGGLGVELSQDDFDRIGSRIPLLWTCNRPVGSSWTICTGAAD